MPRAVRIVLVDGRPLRILAGALVRLGTNCHVHLLSIPAEDQVARAVAAGRQIEKLLRHALCLGITRLILVAHNAVRTAQIEVAIVKRHAENAL